MLVIVKLALPIFDSVTVWAVLVLPTLTLPKLRLVGETVTMAALPEPVPARETVCGLPPPLSATLIDADSEPSAKGAKVTGI